MKDEDHFADLSDNETEPNVSQIGKGSRATLSQKAMQQQHILAQ